MRSSPPRARLVKEKVHRDYVIKATTLSSTLMTKLTEVFGEGTVTAVALDCDDFLKRVGDWQLPSQDVQAWVAFGGSCGDESFKGQISFITSMHSFIVACSPLVQWWMKCKATPDRSQSMDAMTINKDAVRKMQAFRMQHRHFAAVASRPGLEALFSSSAAILSSVSLGKFSAHQLAQDCLRKSEMITDEIAQTWEAQMDGLVAEMRTWSPAGFHDKAKGNIILADEALCNWGSWRNPLRMMVQVSSRPCR